MIVIPSVNITSYLNKEPERLFNEDLLTKIFAASGLGVHTTPHKLEKPR